MKWIREQLVDLHVILRNAEDRTILIDGEKHTVVSVGTVNSTRKFTFTIETIDKNQQYHTIKFEADL